VHLFSAIIIHVLAAGIVVAVLEVHVIQLEIKKGKNHLTDST
jgi:hypothetical protein